MTANVLDNFVIIFPDPAWLSDGDTFEPKQAPANVSFANRITTGLQTLSTNDADPDGSIQGLLYVPDINTDDSCYNKSEALIPRNVTRQSDLPDIDFNLIALAPWIDANCTKSYLAAAHFDPVRAFIFYLPDNSSTQPPPISNSVWSLNDGGQWKSQTPYPVYAVPGILGSGMMEALSLYSGNLTTVPFGKELLTDYKLDARDYVRVYTEISVSSGSSLPGLWVFLLIVVGALAVVLAGTSLTMHLIQRRRREALRRRVANGDVDLEALGIKRLTVPQTIIDKMPLFIYTCNGDESNGSSTDDARQLSADGKVVETTPTQQRNSTTTSLDDPTPRRPPSSSLTAHDYLPHSQPTCPICLDDFESSQTTIRELPCLHIFHPECIDSFLSNNSSLCPMCKKSTLPLGYCPEKITNAMVRRERAIRRLRSRVTITTDLGDVEAGNEGVSAFERFKHAIRIRRVTGRRDTSDNDENYLPPAALAGAVELQPQGVSLNGPSPREQNPHLSRSDIAQLRARELLGGTVLSDDDGPAEDTRPGWRKAIGKVFPGFK